jgi:hypothetical protein
MNMPIFLNDKKFYIINYFNIHKVIMFFSICKEIILKITNYVKHKDMNIF